MVWRWLKRVVRWILLLDPPTAVHEVKCNRAFTRSFVVTNFNNVPALLTKLIESRAGIRLGVQWKPGSDEVCTGVDYYRDPRNLHTFVVVAFYSDPTNYAFPDNK